MGVLYFVQSSNKDNNKSTVIAVQNISVDKTISSLHHLFILIYSNIPKETVDLISIVSSSQVRGQRRLNAVQLVITLRRRLVRDNEPKRLSFNVKMLVVCFAIRYPLLFRCLY